MELLNVLSCGYDTGIILKNIFTLLLFHFGQAEKDAPGFTQELLNGVIQKEAPNEISFTKSLLRMSGQDSQGT